MLTPPVESQIDPISETEKENENEMQTLERNHEDTTNREENQNSLQMADKSVTMSPKSPIKPLNAYERTVIG